MHLFLLFAMGVWYLAFRHRRSWRAAAVLSVGVPAVPMVLRSYAFLFTSQFATLDGTIVHIVSVIYAGLLLFVGVFLASLPRENARFPCEHCRYDLLGNITGRCPECGNHIPFATQIALADELEHTHEATQPAA